jgi:gliding motility associated protien GldN
MKKYWIVSLVITISFFYNYVDAQETQMPFFEKNGTVAIQTTELNSLADTISVINHRRDDIVWSRTVYRIIDMRDKQNYQLYFPVIPNEQYKSLFRVMLDATFNDSLRAYDKIERDIQPLYKRVLSKDSLKNYFQICEKDTINNTIRKTPLIIPDSITQQPVVSTYAYKDYVKNQLKFLIKEKVFFDKHTSRMYSKIEAIAPLYALTETNVTLDTNVDAWSYFQSSVICWFLFDELRPYLARQYVIPNGNDTQRLTYDEFFAQKFYSDYLLGDSNMNNRMLLQYLTDPNKIRKEQKRVETELLNFEQDLWEY